MLDHAVGVFVAGHAALAAHRFPHVGEGMHAGGVHPGEERPVGSHLPRHEVDRRCGGLVVDRLHPLAVQRPGVLDLAVGGRLENAAGRIGLDESRIVLRIVGSLRLLLGVEVVKIAEELVEAVIGRQILVPVAEVVLAELSGGVAERLERLGDRDVAILQPDRRAGNADLAEAGAQAHLTGDEGRAARRAADSPRSSR